MRKVYFLLVITMLACIGCEWRLKSNEEAMDDMNIAIDRYDRIESLYLTTGDYSAMLKMNKTYPMQTRTLIEDVLRIGQVNDPEISAKFLHFFSDSTLQKMINDVQQQFADMEDLNQDLSHAFRRLKEELPTMEMPQVYAQIGSFDQSVIVGHRTLGISLDKYLGADYPFYVKHYTEDQRRMMTRDMIVPDCLGFYILSLFPMQESELNEQERSLHMGKIQWVVNQVMGNDVFSNDRVSLVNQYMKRNKGVSVEQLLRNTDYSAIR